MEMWGIDISHYQGDFKMMQAKAEGARFVIIKAGGADASTICTDRKFETNYAAAIAAGMHVGAYFFANCKTEYEARKEAIEFAAMLMYKKFDMPVYMDVEADMLKLSRRQLTNVIRAFCNELIDRGYYPGIYASRSVFANNVYDEELADYDHWIAQYSCKCTYNGKIGMWQYGGDINYLRSEKVAGVTCDQNYCYVDYPAIIKSEGCNGYPRILFEMQKEEDEDMKKEKEYNTIDDIQAGMPWAVDGIKRLCAAGVVKGNGGKTDKNGYPTDLHLDSDMIRMLIFSLRIHELMN